MKKSILSMLLLAASVAGAQTTESPIPFDSARRVVAVTPAVADRLKLVAPVWPVTGDYREARLYSEDPGGGFVLVAQLPSGAFQRFPLTPVQRDALGSAIDSAMSIAGHPSAEGMTDLVSEPAGNAFARHQTFLAAIAYGPLAASLADDGPAAGGLYLATTGLTFFVSYGAAQGTPFTRAQSSLAGNLGLASATGAWLSGYALTGNSDKGVRAAALGSAIAGTVVGAKLGEHLSDAEAHAATFGIEVAAVAGGALFSGVGADSRSTALAATVAGALGYPIGVRYPRRASYTVTAGDVEATSTAALVGALAGGAIVAANDDPSPRQYITALGGGYLAGALVGDLTLARRFDLTQAQATVLKVGAVAGGLLGLAMPVLADADNTSLAFVLSATGASLGMAALASTFPASSRTSGSRVGATRVGPRFTFTPAGFAAIASRSPGNHVLARLEF